ncbi:transmembrane protein UsgS [Aspergillus ruber CBS 135680]|uniref:Transmembrane protein UsgS n=1 Tax=Aspergillus ruber (strain CBS 135680) TaxID=1388766 RepID=A0A017SMB8_ASPRC|nr:transmembrane protein UsgS [Aspergillus ruber CBS 135680]EYE97435.1 transmembrane protein UsgS [Aspergillus ruber CBS 135680]
MANFEPNAIIRGAQLTVVGTVRALRNAELFKYEHFRQAALAIAVGVIIHVIIQIPIIGLKFIIWIASIFVDMQEVTWDDTVLNGINYLNKSVLQVPFLLMTLMRYVTPTLDEIFMESIRWVDQTYVQKHKAEDPSTLRAMYYPNLAQYSKGGSASSKPIGKSVMLFVQRYGRKVAMLFGIYLLSLLPVVGRFVMPAASFYTFKQNVGTTPAAVIFGTGLVLPKRFIVTFLHTYFASRSLMRELLEPYFCRVPFNPEQKRRWFKDRQGVLFGFAFAFTVVIKTPFIGVLMYGVAEASTAYLITKITDPPPTPDEGPEFAETQVRWKNKHDFLHLPLENIDKLNLPRDHKVGDIGSPGTPGKKFS